MAKIWVEMVVKWPFMSRKFDAPPSKLTLFKPGGQIMPSFPDLKSYLHLY